MYAKSERASPGVRWRNYSKMAYFEMYLLNALFAGNLSRFRRNNGFVLHGCQKHEQLSIYYGIIYYIVRGSWPSSPTVGLIVSPGVSHFRRRFCVQVYLELMTFCFFLGERARDRRREKENRKSIPPTEMNGVVTRGVPRARVCSTNNWQPVSLQQQTPVAD